MQKKTTFSYIMADPEILGGAPVIKGTRIPVQRVVFLIKDGFTLNAIHKQYPHVQVATLKGVVDELLQGVNTHIHATLP